MTTPTRPIPVPSADGGPPASRRQHRHRRLPAGRVRERDGFERAPVGGVPVAVTTIDESVEWLHHWSLERRGGIGVRLVNAFTVVSAHRDPTYLALLRTSGLSLPDGTPVMLALRALARRRDAGRVRGPSFFVQSLDHSEGSGVREFFLGTTGATLDALETGMQRRWPRMDLAGTWAPPFVERIDDAFVELCRAHIERDRPSRVWVALGTPKQDYLAERLSERLGVPCIAVGAAFDFLAGTKREAPKVFQALGAEWVFRLLSEPHRLWRRYVFGNVAFLWILLRERG